MKISRIVDLHADAGWRVFSFLKIETDAGLIGWSEYNESYGSKGLTVDIGELGEHVRERGFTALKTNIFLLDGGSPELYMPGFGRSLGGPELNPSLRVEEALDKQLGAFRDGTGNDVEFLLDVNFNFKT